MDALLRYPLRALRAVEAAGRLGSLAAAAQELGVTVGAVSQQVRIAEQRLGRPIFVRTPRGLAPTPPGERLIAGLARGFQELARAVAAAEARTDHVLTVTVAPVLAAKWLVPRLARFHAARPDLQLRIDASVELVDLAASDVDAGIRVGAGPWPEVRAEHLLDQTLLPVCSPMLAPHCENLDAMLRLPIIRDSGSLHTWRIWLAAHGRTPATLGPGPIFSDAGLCLDAAIAGQGVMIGWPVIAQEALRDGRLVAPFPRPVPSGTAYWLVTSPRRPVPAKVRAFERWLRAELAATVGG